MPVRDGAGRQRVFVHLGPPKTGTTFVQSVLWTNQSELRRAGVLVPGTVKGAHFDAVGDLRGTLRHARRSGKVGAWERLSAEVRSWPGTSVISCEWLAFADEGEAARVLRSFGDAEMHVVLTLRDLGRVVPAVWQERIKNGNHGTMATFLGQVLDPGDRYGGAFWDAHDARRLLARWGDHLPSQRLHVVTVPRSGSSPDELWLRFASLFVADAGQYDTSQVRANPGLDPADAELLRRVNAELGGRLNAGAHAALVKRYLHGELTKQSGGVKTLLPDGAMTAIAERGTQIDTDLRNGDWHLVGDVDDLWVDPAAVATSLPEDTADRDVASAAVGAMAALLLTMQDDGAHRRHGARVAAAGRAARDWAGVGGRARHLARRVAGRVRRVATSG